MRSIFQHVTRLCWISLLALTACQVKQPAPKPAPINAKPSAGAVIAADSPARLCSSEARFYLQFDRIADWRRQRADDPLVAHLWSTIADLRPKGMWDHACRTTGMTEEQLTDRYFGDSLAVIGEHGNTRTPYALLSRVSPTDLAQLPDLLPLTPLSAIHFSPGLDAGPFKTYAGHGGQLLFALHDRWLMIAPIRFKAHFEQSLAYAAGRLQHGTAKTAFPTASNSTHPTPDSLPLPLAEDEHFRSALAKLPADRQFYFYTRDRHRKNRHAAAVVMEGDRLHAHYSGTIDKLDELYQQFAHGDGVDFGFMPRSVISAASLNLVKKDDKGLAALNLFVIPKSIESDVLPKLASPIVVFLSRIEGDRITPDPGTAVPALGVAIHMHDPSVESELNRIVGGLHFLADVSRLDLLGGLLGSRTVRKNGLTYRIADFGDTLTKQIKDPETARMFKLPDAAGLTRLTYGRLGDWFVVCTQEALYHECAAAHADKSLRFTSDPLFGRFPFESREGLIMSALTQAPELAALTAELDAFWQRMEAKAKGEVPQPPKPQPPAESAAASDDSGDEETIEGSRRIRQPMEWIANAIKHRDSFHLQVWRDADGDLRGLMSTLPQTDR